jgi:hypothetical protein
MIVQLAVKTWFLQSKMVAAWSYLTFQPLMAAVHAIDTGKTGEIILPE